MSEHQPESLSALVFSSKLQPPALTDFLPVKISHPAYDVAMDISLIFLHAFPVLCTRSDGVTLYGIPRTLIMDACRIITNFAANSCEDYLASDRGGTSPVSAGDVFLSLGMHFYHLAPDAIPPHWVQPRTIQEDNRIQVAYGHSPSSDMSHRVKSDVPKDELAWFLVNEIKSQRTASKLRLTTVHESHDTVMSESGYTGSTHMNDMENGDAIFPPTTDPGFLAVVRGPARTKLLGGYRKHYQCGCRCRSWRKCTVFQHVGLTPSLMEYLITARISPIQPLHMGSYVITLMGEMTVTVARGEYFLVATS
ncbi:hypothetical protein BD414DRAFT_540509 [Trametes punicea]|nr:hypothetical protein BD414DRAFT_540509 [Trametes punicea]